MTNCETCGKPPQESTCDCEVCARLPAGVCCPADVRPDRCLCEQDWWEDLQGPDAEECAERAS